MDNTEHQKEIADARQRQRENTRESVKKFLMNGDYQGARDASPHTDRSDKLFLEVFDMFHQYAPEPKPCPECGAPMPQEVNDNFQYWTPECQKCNFKKIMETKTGRLPDIMRLSGVPERYQGADMSDFSPSFQKLDINAGIFLHGAPGTGKTRFMCAMYKKMVMTMQPQGYLHESYVPRRVPIYHDFDYGVEFFTLDFPVFISAPNLLVKIKSTFNQRDSVTEDDLIEKYSKVPVLFLDDLGAEYSTEWAVGVIFLLIDRRYNSNLLTHISSNLSLDELAGRINDRVTSRISEMCRVVKTSGYDRRLSLARAA